MKKDHAKSRDELMKELAEARQRLAGAEKALEENRTWLRAFVESAQDGYMLLDSDLRIVDLQRRVVEQGGVKGQSAIGKRLDEFSPGSKTDGRLEQFQEVLRTGEPLYIADYVPSDPPPSPYKGRHASLRAFKVGDKLLAIYTDISAKKEAEEVLRESEARYRLLADNVKDVIWTVDGRDIITYVTPSVKDMLGYEVADLVGQHVSVLMRADPSGSPSYPRMGNIARHAEDRSQSWKVEFEVITSGGDSVWTESTLSLMYDAQGRPNGLLGITRDIRDRKSAEDLFHTMADSSPIGVYISQDRRFQFVNRAFQECVGRTAQELLAMDPTTFVVPQDRRSVRDNARRMLKGQRRSPYEFRFVGKGGKTRWAIERIASVEFNGERAVLGTFMDVTEHKRSEQALARSEKQLRILSKRILQIQEEERGHIARDLHDQLGQQIFVIKMEAEGLIDKLKPGTDPRRRAEELGHMLDQLRGTSRRIAALTRPAIIDDLGLTQAVHRYAEEFERRSGISCPVQAPRADIPLPRATSIVAFRIIQEALTNVWKHAHASQVNITVRAAGNTLTVTVADDGIGMSATASDPSTLGMRGMAERARLVGGTLRVRSKPRQGCAIIARLPMKGEPEGDAVHSEG